LSDCAWPGGRNATDCRLASEAWSRTIRCISAQLDAEEWRDLVGAYLDTASPTAVNSTKPSVRHEPDDGNQHVEGDRSGLDVFAFHKAASAAPPPREASMSHRPHKWSLPPSPLRGPNTTEAKSGAESATSACPRAQRPLERARTLREQLGNGPKPGAQIAAAAQAADIPERFLIAAASDALGVRTQHGQWRLPG
jgi:hypothetical protein